MYPLFGGYWGYMDAPLDEVIRQRCVIIAKHKVDARKNAEVQEKIDERQRALDNR